MPVPCGAVPWQERATVVSRIAPTFLRFGSFEIFKKEDPLTRGSRRAMGRNGWLGKSATLGYPALNS